jgi:hypothetical protein
MSLSERMRDHLRHHVVGYLALFVALSGVAYAAPKITGKQIAKNAITSPKIKDGKVTPADLADESLTGADIAPNGLTGADIDESTLQGVNVLLADGSVTTAKLADSAVTLPKLADAAVSQQKLAFDPATQAELDAATAGIPDSALSSNVALLDAAQSFTAPKTFLGNVSLSLADSENMTLSLVNNTGSGTQEAFNLVNGAGSGTTETLLRLTNADTNTPVTAGLLINEVGGGMETALDVSDGGLATALDVGTNDIKTSTSTIPSTELGTLAESRTRSVSIPLANFVNVDTNQTLDFSSGADSSPDFGAASDRPYIEWDDTGGSADTDQLAAQFEVPADYESGGTIHLLFREFGTVGVNERIICDASKNDTAFGADDTVSAAGVPAFITANIDPVVSYSPSAVIVLRCNVDDGLGGGSANDPVRIHSVAFEYTSVR